MSLNVWRRVAGALRCGATLHAGNVVAAQDGVCIEFDTDNEREAAAKFIRIVGVDAAMQAVENYEAGLEGYRGEY